jgi:hypothetical protein
LTPPTVDPTDRELTPPTQTICFEAITRTFATLEETGLAWPDRKPDWESLRMAMTHAATLGKDGSLGGWTAT